MNTENEKGAPFDESITPFEKAIKEVDEKEKSKSAEDKAKEMYPLTRTTPALDSKARQLRIAFLRGYSYAKPRISELESKVKKYEEALREIEAKGNKWYNNNLSGIATKALEDDSD